MIRSGNTMVCPEDPVPSMAPSLQSSMQRVYFPISSFDVEPVIALEIMVRISDLLEVPSPVQELRPWLLLLSGIIIQYPAFWGQGLVTPLFYPNISRLDDQTMKSISTQLAILGASSSIAGSTFSSAFRFLLDISLADLTTSRNTVAFANGEWVEESRRLEVAN